MQLTIDDIHFDRTINTKDAALQRIAGILADAGHVHASYLDGMREREGQISTWLGNGIAIPHGTPHSRDAVLKTGVKVLACPLGIDWGEGQTAYLVVGIAARDKEHLDILRQLTHALSDERVPVMLKQAETPQAILTILTSNDAPAKRQQPQPPLRVDEEATFTLGNPHGLHARPSAVLVKAAKRWQSQILVENLDTHSAIVDAKNLMRVVSLGAKQGHRLHFMACGDDARQALKALEEAFQAGLGESTVPTPPRDEKTKRSWLSRLFN